MRPPPDEPAARAALEWMRLVLVERDLPAAWPLTDVNLRLCLVHQFIWENRELIDSRIPSNIGTKEQRRDWLAMRLASEDLLPGDWPILQEWVLGFLTDVPSGPWNHLPPRVVAPNLVFIEFLAEGKTSLAPREYAPGAPFLMALHGERWLVAGFRQSPPRPGWPPQGL